MKAADKVLLAVAVLLTALRATVPGHGPSWAGTYEALAHLFVGGLLGAWFVQRRGWYLAVVGAMSMIELVAFLLRPG